MGWQACGLWQYTAVNVLNQSLVNSTLRRHQRKKAKDSRNESNPAVNQYGCADSCWSQKDTNNSPVQPRRDDRPTSSREGQAGRQINVDLSVSFRKKMSQLLLPPSCFTIINSANRGKLQRWWVCVPCTVRKISYCDSQYGQFSF